MLRTLLLGAAIVVAPWFAVSSAEAQVVVTAPTAVGYVPVRTGLFGLRTTMKPVVAPATTAYYAPAVTAPVVTAPVVTNYAPTTTYYTPTTTYYTPTTSYYTPTTTYYTPTTSYYLPSHWYSTPASTPRTVGMPVIGY